MKENGDYESFKPHLKKVINLTRERIKIRDEQEKTIYDTILNDFEKGNMMLNLALSMIKENN